MLKRMDQIPPAELSRIETAGVRRGGGASRTDATGDGAAPIVYSRTRKVTLSPEHLRERRIISGTEGSAFIDAYKILRTQILHRLRESGGNAVAVTSPGDGEGKTVTAINLCIAFAMELDHTVLLVDANLRHPAVHEVLGFPAGPGLSDYLLERKPIEEILVHPGLGGIVVLPGGRPLVNSSELLNSAAMASLVTELKQRYPRRIVVFDLPPVLNTADVLAFSPHVDGTLLVVAEGRTPREDVARATELLGPSGVLGIVLNDAQESMPPVRRKGGGWLGRWRARKPA
jgi:exopolysaccharide/PEP-CTERM locus tyrosine autokinase